MKLLIADTRPNSSSQSPQDRHREELTRALHRSLPGLELAFCDPAAPVGQKGHSSFSGVPWQLSGRRALTYVQVEIPRIAVSLKADAILCLYAGAPLRSPVPVISYEFSIHRTRKSSILGRLASAAGRAGVGAALARVRMADLPGSTLGRDVLLEPWVDPAFMASTEGREDEILKRWELEPGYVLAFGTPKAELATLLAAWTWVVRALADSNPLVLVGLDDSAAAFVQVRGQALDLQSTIRVKGTPVFDELPALYRHAAMFLHCADGSTGQALRWGLASGLPIAAFEDPDTAAIVGDAAYLTPAGDGRTLGGAILSLLVQDDLAQALRMRGKRRSAGYSQAAPLLAWLKGLEQKLR